VPADVINSDRALPSVFETDWRLECLQTKIVFKANESTPTTATLTFYLKLA
jgi:hypothetical protein